MVLFYAILVFYLCETTFNKLTFIKKQFQKSLKLCTFRRFIAVFNIINTGGLNKIVKKKEKQRYRINQHQNIEYKYNEYQLNYRNK